MINLDEADQFDLWMVHQCLLYVEILIRFYIYFNVRIRAINAM